MGLSNESALAELQALVRTHPFWNNRLRVNLGETYMSKWGRKMLVNPILSNSIHGAGRTAKQARMLALVRQLLDVEEPLFLTINKNVTCGRHRDGANVAHSHIMFFGECQGGELVVEEPEGDRVLSERNVWHKFEGGEHYHYNRPHTGLKFSIVAYSQKHVPKGTRRSVANKGLRRAANN
jgi:hypothetical protein